MSEQHEEAVTGKDCGGNFCRSALILGGGKGLRLGYDKKTLTINGIPVLDGIITMLSAIFPQVLLSSNNGAPVREAGRVTVVRDILGEGPLAGIYAGLCAATSDYLYVCACDMPFINAGFIRYVTALIAQDAARAATKDIYIYRAVSKPGGKSAGYEPFNAFYRKTLVHSAEAALEEGAYKLTPFIESASLRILGEEETARFGGETMFWNVNDAKDLRNAEEL